MRTKADGHIRAGEVTPWLRKHDTLATQFPALTSDLSMTVCNSSFRESNAFWPQHTLHSYMHAHIIKTKKLK